MDPNELTSTGLPWGSGKKTIYHHSDHWKTDLCREKISSCSASPHGSCARLPILSLCHDRHELTSVHIFRTDYRYFSFFCENVQTTDMKLLTSLWSLDGCQWRSCRSTYPTPWFSERMDHPSTSSSPDTPPWSPWSQILQLIAMTGLSITSIFLAGNNHLFYMFISTSDRKSVV